MSDCLLEYIWIANMSYFMYKPIATRITPLMLQNKQLAFTLISYGNGIQYRTDRAKDETNPQTTYNHNQHPTINENINEIGKNYLRSNVLNMVNAMNQYKDSHHRKCSPNLHLTLLYDDYNPLQISYHMNTTE